MTAPYKPLLGHAESQRTAGDTTSATVVTRDLVFQTVPDVAPYHKEVGTVSERCKKAARVCVQPTKASKKLAAVSS